MNSIYSTTGTMTGTTTGTTTVSCLTGDSINMLQPLDIVFGRNFTTQCSGKMSTTSFLYLVDKVGRFGDANPTYNYDWLDI